MRKLPCLLAVVSTTQSSALSFLDTALLGCCRSFFGKDRWITWGSLFTRESWPVRLAPALLLLPNLACDIALGHGQRLPTRFLFKYKVSGSLKVHILHFVILPLSRGLPKPALSLWIPSFPPQGGSGGDDAFREEPAPRHSVASSIIHAAPNQTLCSSSRKICLVCTWCVGLGGSWALWADALGERLDTVKATVSSGPCEAARAVELQAPRPRRAFSRHRACFRQVAVNHNSGFDMTPVLS